MKKLPVPCFMSITTATLRDLWSAKQIMLDAAPIQDGTLYADKAYVDVQWSENLKAQYNIQLLTPRKEHKGELLTSSDAFSSFVSGMFQPIEAFSTG